MSRYPTHSQHVSAYHTHLLRNGFDHAVRIGFTPNYHLTVRWQHTDYADAPFRALQRLLEAYRKWSLRTEGGACVALWVRELEGNMVSRVEHAHIALYCPPALQERLNAAIQNWVGAFDDRATLLKPCGSVAGYNARTLVLGYFLKGALPAIRNEHLPARKRKAWSGNQGTINGKRVGVTAAIGPAAIRAYFADCEPSGHGPVHASNDNIGTVQAAADAARAYRDAA